jgi:DNA polymerase epsilon subunit 2
MASKPTAIRNPRLAAIKDPISSDPVLPSSSPAFGTPLPPSQAPRPPPPPNFKPPTVLPIVLPPGTLRPLAFRTFTKKHNLTVSTAALNALATFIGRHCGAGWRDDGLADGVLEETARMWKKQSPSPIVDGESELLKSILKTVESCMSGGKVVPGKGLSRQNSFAVSGDSMETEPALAMRPALHTSDSFGISSLELDPGEDEEDPLKDPREWIKVIDAFEQPRLIYNTAKKHFDKYESISRTIDVTDREKVKNKTIAIPSTST